MANNNRKRSRPTSAAASEQDSDIVQWKKVDVGLLAPSKAAAGSGQADDDDFENAVNHYDEPESKTYRRAEMDLEANPAEGMGLFFGLEVLDGSQYTVIDQGDSKRIVFKGKGTAQDKDNSTEPAPAPGPDIISIKSDGQFKQEKKVTTKKESDVSAETKKKAKEPERSGDTESSSDDKANIADDEETPDVDEERQIQQRKAKKLNKKKQQKLRKKLKKQQKKLEEKDEPDGDAEEASNRGEEQLTSLQTSWMTATGGVTIRPEICKSLLKQNFWSPTPIQAASLPAATLGRRNIVGAAPTGSGT